MTLASGSFETKTEAHPPYDTADGATLGRMTITKAFDGDLVATSTVEMIAARSSTEKASAGYVALERVSGVLHEKKGSFVLMHTGLMNRGAPSLTVVIVPDTGTGELTGISGSMTIDIVEKKHFYKFEYAIG